MNKTEHYMDSIVTNDELIIERPSEHRSLFNTDITLFTYNGNEIVSIDRHKKNMTILAGRLSVMEKAFGISPNKTQRLFLNNMIPNPKQSGDDSETTYTDINHSEDIYNNVESNPNKFNTYVNWFCIGNGGENPNTPYAILDVHDWETRLYNMVPFRFVDESADLSAEEQKQYRLRKVVQLTTDSGPKRYIGYYAKQFNPGTVFSMKSGSQYTPQIADSDPYIGDGSGHPMQGHTSQIYIEFDLEVTDIEFKEFYRATHNNTTTGARLTELGLISGYDAANTNDASRKELANATLFAKLVHDPVFMSSEGSKRKVSYKIFA